MIFIKTFLGQSFMNVISPIWVLTAPRQRLLAAEQQSGLYSNNFPHLHDMPEDSLPNHPLLKVKKKKKKKKKKKINNIEYINKQTNEII